jgi:hypothetical protein
VIRFHLTPEQAGQFHVTYVLRIACLQHPRTPRCSHQSTPLPASVLVVHSDFHSRSVVQRTTERSVIISRLLDFLTHIPSYPHCDNIRAPGPNVVENSETVSKYRPSGVHTCREMVNCPVACYSLMPGWTSLFGATLCSFRQRKRAGATL